MSDERAQQATGVGEGAFRRGEIKALCVVCSEPAPAAPCRRCGAPRCESHALRIDRRCEACERAYELFLQDRIKNPLERWMLALSYLAIIIGTVAAQLLLQPTTLATWAMLLPPLVALALLPLWIGLYRRRAVRQTFLGELPDRRPLALPEAPLEPPPPAPPGKDLSWVALGLTFIFFVPGFSQIGFVLAVIVLNHRGWRAHRPNVIRAIIALVLGLGTTIFWTLLFTHTVRF